jgi:predicted RNA-binding protein with PIN domain
MPMALIIDGYNLLHGANLVGGSVGPKGLERSRQALLDFLVASLEPAELARTTVVFDAANPPPGLPRVTKYQGIAVHFSSAYDDADSLIEELIKADSAPRRLTVVSSDHRLHKAARRRKATAIDSDRWYADVLKRRAERAQSKPVAKKPNHPLSPEEVERWMKEMGGNPSSEPGRPTEEWPRIDNPFPPGYAEDIEDEED